MGDPNQENGGNDFLSFGAGAVLALVIMALFFTVTKYRVEGWVRYAIIFIYVILLVICTRFVDKLRDHGKGKN